MPDATFVPAAVAPARMSLPHVDGLSTPKMPAWSIFLPMVSAMSGLTGSHRSIFRVVHDRIGIGTIAASSSAVICTSSHPVFDVCLSPPSDTQYASGSEASTGWRLLLAAHRHPARAGKQHAGLRKRLDHLLADRVGDERAAQVAAQDLRAEIVCHIMSPLMC